eukprot:TRINITY_DN990_c0_g1_i3.p1 TRINITY_DN990_c0_g1~~TRINITY_DN990_c0_g1_i3.p1  ORF type:complete len:108 (-),score=25.61 TRINITY_DN990_c0_g1_i3:270-593(-)
MVRCHRRFLLINLVLLFYQFITLSLYCFFFFFFNDTATTEIYTLHIVGSVRCVQETDAEYMGILCLLIKYKPTPNPQNNQQVIKLMSKNIIRFTDIKNLNLLTLLIV